MPWSSTETTAGLEGVSTWLGMLAPPRLTGALATKISADAIAIMRSAEMMKRVARDGYETVAGTPAQFRKDMQTELEAVAKVIRSHGIKAQ